MASRKKKGAADNTVSCVLIAKDCISEARFKRVMCELFMVEDIAIVCLQPGKCRSLTAAIRISKEVYEALFYPACLFKTKKGWMERVEAKVPKRLICIVERVGLGLSSR